MIKVERRREMIYKFVRKHKRRTKAMCKFFDVKLQTIYADVAALKDRGIVSAKFNLNGKNVGYYSYEGQYHNLAQFEDNPCGQPDICNCRHGNECYLSVKCKACA
jgi:Fe2+ or Zn2+ uptake regulation protein